MQNLLFPKHRLLQNLIQFIIYNTNTKSVYIKICFVADRYKNQCFPMFPKFSEGNPKNIQRGYARNKSRVSFGSDISFNTLLRSRFYISLTVVGSAVKLSWQRVHTAGIENFRPSHDFQRFLFQVFGDLKVAAFSRVMSPFLESIRLSPVMSPFPCNRRSSDGTYV